jgi:hypothetical protein
MLLPSSGRKRKQSEERTSVDIGKRDEIRERNGDLYDRKYFPLLPQATRNLNWRHSRKHLTDTSDLRSHGAYMKSITFWEGGGGAGSQFARSQSGNYEFMFKPFKDISTDRPTVFWIKEYPM